MGLDIEGDESGRLGKLQHGLWKAVIDIPPPRAPPFDIETFEPVEPPRRGAGGGPGKGRAAMAGHPRMDSGRRGGTSFDLFDQRPDSGKPVEIPLEDGETLVLDSD